MNWNTLTKEEQLVAIQSAIQEHVLPMLAGHGGGIEIKELEGNTLKIAYQGACLGCPMALQGTLQFIQKMLHDNVSPEITVVPAL